MLTLTGPVTKRNRLFPQSGVGSECMVGDSETIGLAVTLTFRTRASVAAANHKSEADVYVQVDYFRVARHRDAIMEGSSSAAIRRAAPVASHTDARGAFRQKLSFRANCSWRESIAVLVITPKLAVRRVPPGGPKIGWFGKLKASARNSSLPCSRN